MYLEGEVPYVSANGNNNGGFGNGWEGLIGLALVASLFGGFGFGGNRGGGYGGAADGYVLATDFASIERKIDGVNAGLCDGFYATAQQINGVQQTLCQGFAGINQNIVTNGYETRNAITDVGYRLQDCCCQTLRALDSNTRYIIDNQNANYRAIHEELVANKLEAKNERIAEQQNEINALRLKASQEAQNNYLLRELKPCPSAAYIVPNPNCCYNYNVTGFGYGNSCGGCNNF